jgi:hypothetical protein
LAERAAAGEDYLDSGFPWHPRTPPPGLAEAAPPRLHTHHGWVQPRPPRPANRGSIPPAAHTSCGEEDSEGPAQRRRNATGEARGHVKFRLLGDIRVPVARRHDRNAVLAEDKRFELLRGCPNTLSKSLDTRVRRGCHRL